MDFLFSLLANLLANVAFWLGAGLIVAFFISRDIRMLRRFFGIDVNNRLVVFLSRRDIDSSLVKDCYGDTERRQKLVSLDEGEFEEIPDLVQLLSKRTWLRSPSTFQGLVDTIFSISQPKIEFRVAPSCETAYEELPGYPTICIGSSKYNTATKLFLDKSKIDLKYNRTLTNLPYDVGYLRRFSTCDRRIIIIAGGLGINGTRAAVHCLVLNWRKLQVKHGDRDFMITLVCRKECDDVNGHIGYIEVSVNEGEEDATRRLPPLARHSISVRDE